MYETLTEEQVKRRILERLDTGLMTCEGSFTGDVVAAIAAEICWCYHAMDSLAGMFYIDEASGPYIDKQAAMVGITRKAGTSAACAIRFTGTDGAGIPAGTPFYTAGGLAFYLENAVTIENGAAVGTLAAAEVGAAYNIGAEEIVSTLKNYYGISGYTNAAASGGTDPETDAALVGRYYARLRRAPTSGNPYHYQQWAQEVDGIGFARVIAKWDGPGTVKVLVASPEGGAAEVEAVDAVAEHIAAERPVGPEITVLPAAAKPLTIHAAVTIDGSTTKGQVKAALADAVADYLRRLVEEHFTRNLDAELDAIDGETYTVLYNRVSFLLLSIPGVVDYEVLTVGGGTRNITVTAEEVPVLEEVSVA